MDIGKTERKMEKV